MFRFDFVSGLILYKNSSEIQALTKKLIIMQGNEEYKHNRQSVDSEADYIAGRRRQPNDARRPMSADDSHYTNKDYETD